MEKDYTLIKPHHFLDYLYDMGIDYRHEDEVNNFGIDKALAIYKRKDLL